MYGVSTIAYVQHAFQTITQERFAGEQAIMIRRNIPNYLFAAVAYAWCSFAYIAVDALADDQSAEAKTASQRPRIGLVLGGGGARGAAHIGVIKVLEEMHIPV